MEETAANSPAFNQWVSLSLPPPINGKEAESSGFFAAAVDVFFSFGAFFDDMSVGGRKSDDADMMMMMVSATRGKSLTLLTSSINVRT